MLSNTATPIYYGQYRERVLNGEIPVCREISMQMNRIDALIDDPRIYYDDQAVEGFIRFCENELTLADGSPVHMLDIFKVWAEDLLSWYYFTERSVFQPDPNNRGGHYVRKRIKKRLINKQYLIVGRGAAKSMYASFLQSYFLVVDTTTTQQITTAPTMNQVDGVVSPIKTAILRSRGPLFSFLTEGSIHNTRGNGANRAKLCTTKNGIENFMTGSMLKVLPMSIDKLQGYKPTFTTVDEWLSGDVREDVVGAIEQGAAKNENWAIVAISSEGTVRNGPGDSIKMELMSILKGEAVAPHISIWHYKLDDINEVNDPAMWVKANPNLEVTVSYETYQQEVERAERAPSTRNDILAKRFGIPMEGYTYYFTYEETKRTESPQDFWQCQCAMGADLSRGDDFCAFTFLFPLSGYRFGVKTVAYITERTLANLQPAMREKYNEFLNEGTLFVMNGTNLDMMDVYEDLERYIDDHQYDVVAFGYDPYNAKAFVQRWETEHGPFGIEKVIQGYKTESVPLGELKILAEDHRLVFDESLMEFGMGNAIVLMDTNGNRKLYKQRHDEKVDSVAALMDAWVAYKVNKELF